MIVLQRRRGWKEGRGGGEGRKGKEGVCVCVQACAILLCAV